MNQAFEQFKEDLRAAQQAADDALIAFIEMKKEQRVRERWARMRAYQLQKTITNLGHVQRLAVGSWGDSTKDGGAWLPNSNTEVQP